MKSIFGSVSFLIALLLSASSSVGCGSRGVNTQGTNAMQSNAVRVDDSSAPAGWKRYDFEKPVAFSLVLPGGPESRVTAIPEHSESKQVFISHSNFGVYGAVYIADLSGVAGKWKSGGDKLYEVFIYEFAAKLTGKGEASSVEFDMIRFTTGRQVMVSGLEGWERDFSIGDLRGRLQLVRFGPAGFCLVGIWKQSAPLAEQDTFFNSAKVAGESTMR